jgi:hypothetical protein
MIYKEEVLEADMMVFRREENWKRLQICCLDNVTEAGL